MNLSLKSMILCQVSTDQKYEMIDHWKIPILSQYLPLITFAHKIALDMVGGSNQDKYKEGSGYHVYVNTCFSMFLNVCPCVPKMVIMHSHMGCISVYSLPKLSNLNKPIICTSVYLSFDVNSTASSQDLVNVFFLTISSAENWLIGIANFFRQLIFNKRQTSDTLFLTVKKDFRLKGWIKFDDENFLELCHDENRHLFVVFDQAYQVQLTCLYFPFNQSVICTTWPQSVARRLKCDF